MFKKAVVKIQCFLLIVQYETSRPMFRVCLQWGKSMYVCVRVVPVGACGACVNIQGHKLINSSYRTVRSLADHWLTESIIQSIKNTASEPNNMILANTCI